MSKKKAAALLHKYRKRMDGKENSSVDAHQRKRELYLDLRKLKKWTKKWEEDLSLCYKKWKR